MVQLIKSMEGIKILMTSHYEILISLRKAARARTHSSVIGCAHRHAGLFTPYPTLRFEIEHRQGAKAENNRGQELVSRPQEGKWNCRTSATVLAPMNRLEVARTEHLRKIKVRIGRGTKRSSPTQCFTKKSMRPKTTTGIITSIM
jgi:hypothetical protein